MVIIKFWRFENNVTEAEGLTLRHAFRDLLEYYPDFLEKCASFEYDELNYAVERGHLTLEDDNSYDLSVDDDEGNIKYYAYTDEGIEELLFRAKDNNNYDYIISKF